MLPSLIAALFRLVARFPVIPFVKESKDANAGGRADKEAGKVAIPHPEAVTTGGSV